MISKKKLLTVIFSFLPFEKLICLNLYENIGLSLDDLALDIYRIIRNPNTIKLYYASLLLDLEYMAYIYRDDKDVSFSVQEIQKELDLIIRILYCKIRKVTIEGKSSLIGIHFEKPESLIVDFSDDE